MTSFPATPHKSCIYCAVCANKEKIKEIKYVSVALQKTQSQRVVFKQTLSVQSQTLPLPTVTVFTRVRYTETSIVLQDLATRPAPPSQPKWHWKIWKMEESPVVTLPLDLVMFQNLFLKLPLGISKQLRKAVGATL